MTLSFTTHWRDELPDFYTALAPTPSTAATSSARGPDSSATGAVFCLANSSWPMAAALTGT